VQRIQEVRVLRAAQFPEDAGPMAHPIRPESFIEISNFYTATVYKKGAEVVRMIHTLIGARAISAPAWISISSATTARRSRCEDFVAAMQDASGVDLGLFQRWYGQAGTPHLQVSGSYDAAARVVTPCSSTQSCAPTPGAAAQAALPDPDSAGAARPGRPRTAAAPWTASDAAAGNSRVLSLCEAREQAGCSKTSTLAPVPSLLRGFSAPVVLRFRLQRRRARPSHGPRRRSVQSLGSRAAPRARRAARRHRRHPRGARRAGRTISSLPADA
jgi:aminopeptidase N